MNENATFILLLAALGCAGFLLIVLSARRSALDVLNDLDDEPETQKTFSGTLSCKLGGGALDELAQAGLFSNEAKKAFLLRGRLYPVLFAGGMISAKELLLPGKPDTLPAVAILGLSVGYLLQRSRLGRAKARYMKSLEFYLPVVMERLVMAVQSGLDITAALGAIVALEQGEGEDDSEKEKTIDPVTRLLFSVHGLAEGGLTFEQALRRVAEHVECSAVRHAFIHLAVAHAEGGELVKPLKELSDSTQLCYQESVDEQIAKLPVQATLPLLCTFSGLILCFITPPIMQLMHLIGGTAKNLR